MTRRTRGTVDGVAETYDGLLDWYLTISAVAVPITTETWSTFEIVVQNDPDSADDVRIGNQWSQSALLLPGQSETFSLCDPRLIYVRADTTTARINIHCVT